MVFVSAMASTCRCRPPVIPLANEPQIVSPLEMGEAFREMKELAELPPEDLAKKITDAAQEQARIWGLLPPDGSPPPPQ